MTLLIPLRLLLLSVIFLVPTCGGLFAQQISKDSLLDFVNTRYQAYFHYNMCTFKNVNDDEQHHGRSRGTEPVEMWNPSGLDCDQWAQVCVDARMTGGWLTTKHHGGFCIWDSKHTDYDIASSPVKTDVVGEFVKAFRERGLKIGFYYSVLDYHHGIDNGTVTQEKIEFMKAQIAELLTGYGPIDYMNFDGWSTWPTLPDYDDVPYDELFRVVKKIQPDCLIVSHTYESNLAHTEIPFADAAGRAYPYHPGYMRPTAASDTSQKDWWWDNIESYRKPKSKSYLLKQLESYNSHNSVYVLNLSPGPNGRLDDNLVQRLDEVAQAWEKPTDLTEYSDNWGYLYDVSQNLAFHKPATQSTTAGPVLDMRARPRAEIAVDGVTEGVGAMEQCALTVEEMSPWWKVDLQTDCRIDEVRVHFQTDAKDRERTPISLAVFDEAGRPIWTKLVESSSPEYTNANLLAVPIGKEGVVGRSIRIKAVSNNTVLGLAEVIVTGEVK